jgi:type 1 glutamine amidotransferase
MVQSFADLAVTVSSDPSALVTLSPDSFDVLVFPCVCPWQLTDQIQTSISQFISAGRGFVGIHCAADTANFAAGGGIDPTWYRENLLGGLHWSGYPWLLTTVHRNDVRHPSTSMPTMNWDNSAAFEDEMYAFRPLEANRIHLLLTISTPPLFIDPMGDAYSGAAYVLPHPSSFCRQNIGQKGGRSWVTALGHVSGLSFEPGDTYALPWFQDHVHGGILWAAGDSLGDCPDDNPPLRSP